MHRPIGPKSTLAIGLHAARQGPLHRRILIRKFPNPYSAL